MLYLNAFVIKCLTVSQKKSKFAILMRCSSLLFVLHYNIITEKVYIYLTSNYYIFVHRQRESLAFLANVKITRTFIVSIIL